MDWTERGAGVLFRMLAVLGVALCGCLGEAQHSNPVDPNSDEFEPTGTLAGSTTRFYPPFTVLEDAQVHASPGSFVVRSDADGRFTLRDLPEGEYEVSAVRNGFVSDTQSVHVEVGSVVDTLQIRLDGLPVFREVAVRSVHVSRWFPAQDLYLLEVVAAVEDPDGLSDLDRVWLDVFDESFERELPETGVAGRFMLMVPSDSLPGENLHGLQGSDIFVHARDDAGFASTSAPQRLVRVIDYTPVATSPQGQVVLETSTPTLEWEDATLPFSFSYRIDVVRDQANVQTLVDTVRDISPDSTSYRLETPLPAGTYFWTVSVVDSFGNRSRSKEAGFIIE